MQAFIEEYGLLLLGGVGETLFMTLVPTLFAYVLGLPMGVLLTITKPGGIAEAPRFNAVFGWLVNILRSLPFMILMIFIIPLTRFIAGTSIGATAACVPLTIAAAPFVARMVEQSLEEIDRGTVEAARCMGATNWQIVTRVLLVESVPSLLRGLSISTITILGYRRGGRRRAWQHCLPLRLPALPERPDVRDGGAADSAGLPDPGRVQPDRPPRRQAQPLSLLKTAARPRWRYRKLCRYGTAARPRTLSPTKRDRGVLL